jgi:hypothetical protein
VVRPAAVGGRAPGRDRFFGGRHCSALQTTKARKAQAIDIYCEFLEMRHQPDIYAATGRVVESPLDE